MYGILVTCLSCTKKRVVYQHLLSPFNKKVFFCLCIWKCDLLVLCETGSLVTLMGNEASVLKVVQHIWEQRKKATGWTRTRHRLLPLTFCMYVCSENSCEIPLAQYKLGGRSTRPLCYQCTLFGAVAITLSLLFTVKCYIAAHSQGLWLETGLFVEFGSVLVCHSEN